MATCIAQNGPGITITITITIIVVIIGIIIIIIRSHFGSPQRKPRC